MHMRILPVIRTLYSCTFNYTSICDCRCEEYTGVYVRTDHNQDPVGMVDSPAYESPRVLYDNIESHETPAKVCIYEEMK